MKITNDFLTINPYSRPHIIRQQTTKIAVHWVANPMSTAKNNRDYFENQKINHYSVSSNYIVGLDGEVICCVPDEEIAYCTNQANSYSVSVETCHPDWTGKFNSKTYKSLVELCAYLLKKYKLSSEGLIRHFDVTGKDCPKCFVPASKGGTDTENADAWKKFKADVKAEMAATTTPAPTASKLLEIPSDLYRIRKAWNDVKSQIGAFTSLDNAKKACISGYSVFDSKGNKVYTAPEKSLKQGDSVALSNANLYKSSTTTAISRKISGTYYIYDGIISKDRIKITNRKDFCGKLPVGSYVTGWVNVKDIK